MIMTYIIAGAFAFLLTIGLSLLALKFFPKWGLLDRPEKYGLKRKPIPYSGGLLLFFVFLICSLIFLDYDKHLIGLTVGASLIILVSFLDDRYDLSPYLRIVVHIIAALILVFSGIGMKSISNPLGGLIDLEAYQVPIQIGDIFYHFTLLADIFTIFWVVILSNVMNWLDGLNGLPSGISFIGFVVIFILSIRPGQTIDQSYVSILSIIMASICLAFWFFDFYPAKILMGDTGSMFLGFMLATLAIFSGSKIATAFLVLGIPILDAVWIFFRRVLEKKSPVKGDLKHFHHRLLYAGLSHRKALVFNYVLCAFFGAAALLLKSSIHKLFAILALIIIMFFVGATVVYRGRKNGNGLN